MNIQQYLSEPIKWNCSARPEFPYDATHEGIRMTIRVNDFPDEHLYTLLVGDLSVDFDDWPEIWTRGARAAKAKAPGIRAIENTSQNGLSASTARNFPAWTGVPPPGLRKALAVLTNRKTKIQAVIAL